MTLTEAFIEFTLDTKNDDLPQPVRALAARCLLDHLGCAVGGMQTELGQFVAEMVISDGGKAQATVLAANGVQVPAPAAALANGTAANALDYDDTLLGHPGATVCSATLAVSEWIDAGGKELLRSIVIGYEICARLALYCQPIGGRYVRVWDSATLQTFGVVAAVAALLRLTAAQLEQAFGIAAATAPMPRVRPPADGDGQLRPMLKSAWGWAAEAGVRAAILAKAGLTGQQRALDYLTLVWQPKWQPYAGLNGPTEKLGQQFLIEHVEFKPYPACRFLHSALDVVSDFIDAGSFTWRDVQEVKVAGFSLLGDAFHNIPVPSSRSEAQFSTPYCVASLLYHGRLAPSAFDNEALMNEELLSLSRRVIIETDPTYERNFPKKAGSRVTLVSTDGGVWENSSDEPRGTPAKPLPIDALITKFVQLVEPAIADLDAQSMAHEVLQVEECVSVRAFMRRFQAPSCVSETGTEGG